MIRSLGARRTTLAGVLAGSVLLGAGGVVAASYVRSPQQAAADLGPPAPSVLSAVVERRTLTDTVVVRGQIAAGGIFELAPAVRSEGKAVVTAIRTRLGAEVEAGQVLIEVSGRPVVILPGAVPAFRDLRPGAEGADISQLQAALSLLGYSTGSDRKGTFGAGTKRAVANFYDAIGYAAPTSGDEEAVEAASAGVRVGQRAVADATRALDLAREAAAASTASPGPGQPDPVEEAELRLERAKEDLAETRIAHAKAVAASGPVLPLGEYIFLPQLPARVQELTAKVGDEVGEALLTLSTGALVVTSLVDPGTRDVLAPGMEVEIASELTGTTATGTISQIGEAETSEQAGAGYQVTVIPDEPLSDELAGHDVRLTVLAASTPGPVLVVPVSAVSATTDGSTIVVKLGADGTETRIAVLAGASGDGYVEISPEQDDALAEGDRVVIGT